MSSLSFYWSRWKHFKGFYQTCTYLWYHLLEAHVYQDMLEKGLRSAHSWTWVFEILRSYSHDWHHAPPSWNVTFSPKAWLFLILLPQPPGEPHQVHAQQWLGLLSQLTHFLYRQESGRSGLWEQSSSELSMGSQTWNTWPRGSRVRVLEPGPQQIGCSVWKVSFVTPFSSDNLRYS